MKLNRYLTAVLSVAALLFAGGCGSDGKEDIPEESGFVVEAPRTVECGSSSVTLEAGFKAKGGSRQSKAGFALSEKPGAGADAEFYDATVDGETFKASITGLKPGCEYYVRAFVSEFLGGVTYSKEISFTTTEVTLDEQVKNYRGPQYPDYYVELAAWEKRSQWNLANVHDPTVMKAADGYFYMYQTDASYGNAHEQDGHLHGRRSKDLVNWEYLGGTMHSMPDWVEPKLNEIREGMGLAPLTLDKSDFAIWAPSAVKVSDNLYRMYYALVLPGHIDGDFSWVERSFIGLMETTDPSDNNSWEDKGFVITNCSDKGLDFHMAPDDWGNCYFKFNAIDPSAIITDNGEHWLIYGSWHSGIAAVKLDAATGKVAAQLGKPWGTDADVAAYGKRVATRQLGNRWQGSEAPEVIFRDGYYYLFLAYDALDVPYNTRVVRSRNIDGPYVDINGVNVSDNGGDALPVVTHPYKFSDSQGWVGFSHCTVFDDGEGNWYYASQARMPAGVNGNPYSNAIMMGHVRSIMWTKEGWPLVMPERYGAVPQVEIAEEELAGSWEIIDLGYVYGVMKESVVMTLTADHQVNGAPWKGSKWSYDRQTGILNIGGTELYLKRECDWEDASRRATIVCAGISNTTWWGKKKI